MTTSVNRFYPGRLLVALGLCLLIGFGLVGSAFATILQDDIIITEDFTLRAGEVIDGSLIVTNGSVSVENGAVVKENLVVYGGSVSLAGQVNGDVTVFGGTFEAQSTAIITGQLALPGGVVTQHPGAQILGSLSGPMLTMTAPPPVPPTPTPPAPTQPTNSVVRQLLDVGQMVGDRLIGFIAQAATLLGLSLGMAVIAVFTAVFFSESLTRSSNMLKASPLICFVVGLLTLIVGPIVMVLTAITICLIPVTIASAVLYAAAIVFGWLALGTVFGNKLAEIFGLHSFGLAANAAIGTFLITFLTALIGYAPWWCGPAIIQALIASVGLGAAILTRFGTLKPI